MKQYRLFMCVVRTLLSWTASHILVVWSITMVGHIKKSYGRLGWPMVLWTLSAQVYGITVVFAAYMGKVMHTLWVNKFFCDCDVLLYF